jgi:hypothetical protein
MVFPSRLGSPLAPCDPDDVDVNGSDAIGSGLDRDGTEIVLIDSVRPTESPRLSGVSLEHARVLQEKLLEVPAILVNRRTMQVVDGMHRLRAAKLHGDETIRVEFVDLSEQDAFLLAVRANVEHGLPLSLPDREAAALRILGWYPLWSDRAIAEIVGLAPATLAALRGRSTACSAQSNTRLGRDGRVRPVSTLDGRMRASEILSARPETPLRLVAAESGISLGTAHDVRERLRRGADPVPDRQRAAEGRGSGGCSRRGPLRRRRRGEPVAWSSIRHSLMRDPTMRYVASGREFLRWMDAHAISGESWQSAMAAIPSHWAGAIAGAAYACGDEWHEFAEALQQRAEDMSGSGDGQRSSREAPERVVRDGAA